jgi:hypothetical protein
VLSAITSDSTKFKGADVDIPISNSGYATLNWVYTPSATVLLTDATEFNRNNTAYAKLKEYTIPALCSGNFRITYNLKCSAGITAYCKLYKNGVAIADTGKSTLLTSYVSQTVDITGFVATDTIEFWVKCAGGGAGFIKDCTISGTSAYQPVKKEPSWS